MQYEREWGESIEAISFWLKQLIIVLILAGFLELTLPDNQLKGVAKLIMGLLIILLLIQPVSQMLNLPLSIVWITPSKLNQSSETKKVIREGLKLRESWQRQITVEQERFWQQKIKQVTGMVTGVKVKRIVLYFQDNAPAQVRLWVSANGTQTEHWWRKDVEQRLRNAVQLVSDLREEKIEVNWND